MSLQSSILYVVLLFISCWSLSRGQHGFVHNHGYPNNFCQTPLGDVGSCVSLKDCPEVLTLFQKLDISSAKQYSMELKRLCGNRVTPDQYPVLCCKNVVRTMPQDNEYPVNTYTTMRTTSSSSPPTTTTTTTTTESPAAVTTTENVNKIINTPTVLCLTYDLKSGSCKPLKDCPPLVDQLKAEPDNEDFKSNLRKSHASCGNQSTVVCCPAVSTITSSSPSPNPRNLNNPTHQLPTEDQGCGQVNQTSPKIVGGDESQIGAWPWMALIGYDPYSVRPFKCGGTLVSNRHVITAAHCIRHDLSFVRLGEFDLSTESETRHVDINVIKNVKHPMFGKNRRSDLAILLLETTVQFTDQIAPICMPNSVRLRSKSYVDSMPFVAGWGYTQQGGSSSHILKEAQLPILKNDICRRIYKQLLPSTADEEYDEAIICAGYTVGGVDTCQGDSGGPLMIPELYKGITRYYLIGVVSYGHGCAKVPGIYISTQHWMDWILEQIETM